MCFNWKLAVGAWRIRIDVNMAISLAFMVRANSVGSIFTA